MDQLRSKLDQYMNENLQQIIVSNRRAAGELRKVEIHPFLSHDTLQFQVAKYTEKQVFHSNMDAEKTVDYICSVLLSDFKQIEVTSNTGVLTALINKKGKATCKEKKCLTENTRDLSHNRKKKYILEEGRVVPFLVDLGVQTKEGKIVNKMYDKYRQINRFLEFIQDILPSLPKDKRLTIIDFGCGKSYLTFAVYYYLHVLQDYEVNMIGLDLKEDVIAYCNKLRDQYGYSDLNFLVGDIEHYKGVSQVDMVITLHACDTATDYALYKAVRWGAKVILSVPCCQHEANHQMECEAFEPILKYGLVKERFAALYTDAIRGNLLEQQGYDVSLIEFVDMAHTPKNLLIRAVRQGDCKSDDRIDKMQNQFHTNLTFARLLEGKETLHDSDQK